MSEHRSKIKQTRTAAAKVSGDGGVIAGVENKPLATAKGKDSNNTTKAISRSSVVVAPKPKVTDRGAGAAVTKKSKVEVEPRIKPSISAAYTTNKDKAIPVIKAKPSTGKDKVISTRSTAKEGKGSSSTAAKQPSLSANSNNVMNRVHNVTVASPTLKRKEGTGTDESSSVSHQSPPPEEDIQPQKPRIRTKTRTIDPEQSVMQKYLQQQAAATAAQDVSTPPSPIAEPTPPPIAFEISLDSCPVVSSENEYEDDFESYESDFESEPSEEEEEEDDRDKDVPSDQEGNINDPEAFPEQDKNGERKLDSGNYDLPVSKDRSILGEIQETTEQVDQEILVNKASLQVPKKINLSTRQMTKLKTLSLDMTTTVHIFEQKPMDYERFMRVFGHLSSSQVSVQTKFDDVCDEEVQTDEIEMSSRWTQNPPQFGKGAVQGGGSMFTKSNRKYQEEAVGVGLERGVDDRVEVPQLTHTHVDYERLNRFLISSSNTIAQIVIDGKYADKEQMGERSRLEHCNEYLQIHSRLLSAGYLVKSSHAFGHVIVIVLAGQDRKGVELMEMYDSAYLEAPQSILMSRNPISSVLIHSKNPSYLLGGTVEGCINLWNWPAGASHQEEDESVLRKRPAISSAIPDFLSTYAEYCTLVKIVELTSDNTHYSISGEDVAALYSPGIIVIWSIETINNKATTLKEVKTIELHNKPVISKGMKSKFEKNVTYFENNIFSDAALQELDTVKSAVDQAHNLIFIDLLFDGELLIAISNQNFITITTMGLQNDTKKIVVTDVSDTSVVRITAASVYSRGMLLISLSDGTLKLQAIKSPANENWDSDFQEKEELFDPPKHNELTIAEKSCAIQNIVLNERKLYDTEQAKRNLDSLETWKEGQSSAGTLAKAPSNADVQIERVLIHGAYFSRSYISDLQILDSAAIYFLDRQELKAYDLVAGRLSSVEGTVNGMTVSKNDNGKAQFLITYGDNFIHLHRVAST